MRDGLDGASGKNAKEFCTAAIAAGSGGVRLQSLPYETFVPAPRVSRQFLRGIRHDDQLDRRR